MAKIKSAEEYIREKIHWSDELNILRKLILQTELKETIKWGAPVYTLDGKNVVGLTGFKNHFGIWFYNGVFLKDKEKALVNAQEGKTKALRQMRFNSSEDISPDIVLSYVKEAIANQKAGKEIKPNRKGETVNVPSELQFILSSNDTLNNSFKSLSPGKQREYCDYIESAKRDATKQTRLKKITPMILNGVGLNDKYKNC